MDIKALQGDFIEAIFGGDKEAAVSHIAGDEILTAEQRLGIYSGSVHGILTQALGVMFPVCKSLVGDKFFDNMSKIFIDQNPPDTCFFADYGSQLPQFISTFEHTKDIPYLQDVARLEWIRQMIWHDEKPQYSDFSGLATLSEDVQGTVVFNLTKRMRLIQSDYRIDDLWFAHQPDSEIELENIDINQAIKLIVKRDDNIIKISTFSESEEDSNFWDFLHAISKGNNLEALAEQFGESLGLHLNQGIQGGWIQSFST